MTTDFVLGRTGSPSARSRSRYARLAGFMYLFVIVAYLVPMAIRSRFVVAGRFAETAQRVTAAEVLYRFGTAWNLVAALCTVLLAMGLYVTLREVDDKLALLAFAFRLAEAVLVGVQVTLGFAAIRLYAAAGTASPFNVDQLAALMALRSAVGSVGFNVGAIFFAVGSVLFFHLFLRTTCIPRPLSAIGFYGSLLVLVVCFGSLIAPPAASILQYGWIPIAVAEIGTGVLLLIHGTNLEQRASSPTL